MPPEPGVGWSFWSCPLFPAIMGTLNYLGNLEIAGQSEWYSLWSQHTLFSAMFFHAGAVWCVLCLAVAAGAHGSQLEQPDDRPGAGAGPLLEQVSPGRRCGGAGAGLHWGTVSA